MSAIANNTGHLFRLSPSKLAKILTPGLTTKKYKAPDFDESEPSEHAKKNVLAHGSLLEEAALEALKRVLGNPESFRDQDPFARLNDHFTGDELRSQILSQEYVIDYANMLQEEKGVVLDKDQQAALKHHENLLERLQTGDIGLRDMNKEGRYPRVYDGRVFFVGQPDGSVRMGLNGSGNPIRTAIEIKCPVGGAYKNSAEPKKRRWYSYFIQLAVEMWLMDVDQVLFAQYVAPSGFFPNRPTSLKMMYVTRESLRQLTSLLFSFVDEMIAHKNVVDNCKEKNDKQKMELLENTKMIEIHEKIIKELIALGDSQIWRTPESYVSVPASSSEAVSSSIRIDVTGFHYPQEGSRPEGRVAGELVRDPKNPYDSNAIKVMWDKKMVGFVRKEKAAILSPLMGENSVSCQLSFRQIDMGTFRLLNCYIDASKYGDLVDALAQARPAARQKPLQVLRF